MSEGDDAGRGDASRSEDEIIEAQVVEPSVANPYTTPADTSAAMSPEPRVGLWVTACAIIGAVAMGVVELVGRMPLLTVSLPAGLGGVSIGALIGALCGRIIGRLLVARHRFRSMANRRFELNEELLERRGRK